MSSLLLVLTAVQNSETRALIKSVLDGAGHRVVESTDYQRAQLLLENGLYPDLLVASCPAESATSRAEYQKLMKSIPADRVCLVIGIDEEQRRQEAYKLGVTHFLMKPVARGDLESLIGQWSYSTPHGEACGKLGCPSTQSASRETGIPGDMPASPYIEELGGGSFFLAASPKMLEIHRQVKLLADADVNVLVLGESGTGKEVIARVIHRNSHRSRDKFLKVNCAALPADLLESELFGHRQGAFTGAIKDQKGKFEQADGGTLLLDEIGELSVQIQAKLLHVLQDGQFTRLGGQECSSVNVRVIAATNVQMGNALLEKTFREDLYYRLSVFTINVPPLRERREEIPYLIEETVRRAPAELKHGGGCQITSRLLDAALLYHWPGNLRELHNFVTRTIIMRDPDAARLELEAKVEEASDASSMLCSLARMPKSSGSSGMRSIVRDLKERTEMQMIQDALEASRWNRRQAAQYLNISYRALLYKIQQHNLTPRLAGTFNEILGANGRAN